MDGINYLGYNLVLIGFLEPSMVLLVEHPILLFELDGRKVLLIGPLLKIERKE